MAIAPITGMLRKNLILDLSIGLGIGVVMGSTFWWGFHVPRTNRRDAYYRQIEEERIKARG